MQGQFEKHFRQILTLVQSLSQLCIERELSFAMKEVELQMRSATTADRVSEILSSFQMHTGAKLVKHFGMEHENVVSALDKVSKNAQAIVMRPQQISEQKMQYFLKRKLGADTQEMAEPLEEWLKRVDGEKLFAMLFRPDELPLVETMVLDALKQPAEPLLCQHQDVKSLVLEQLNMMEQAHFVEKCRRFHLELPGAELKLLHAVSSCQTALHAFNVFR